MKILRASTRKQVRFLKIIFPIGIFITVIIYQLVLVRYIHEWGHELHYASEIFLYGIVGPIVTFLVLLWIERQLLMRERAENEAILERERRETAVLEERSRIAREIHEGVTQNLYFLGLQFDLLKKKLPDQSDDLSSEITSLQDLLQESVSDLRRLIWALRPADLERLGPVKAIERLAQDLEQHTQIKIELNLEDLSQRLSPHQEGALYRIVQESLNNIAKHAMCDKATVTIKIQEDQLMVTVKDYGCGFDTAKIYNNSFKGMGLRHVRERAEEVGGSLRIESTSGSGTILSAILPLNDRNND